MFRVQTPFFVRRKTGLKTLSVGTVNVNRFEYEKSPIVTLRRAAVKSVCLVRRMMATSTCVFESAVCVLPCWEKKAFD